MRHRYARQRAVTAGQFSSSFVAIDWKITEDCCGRPNFHCPFVWVLPLPRYLTARPSGRPRAPVCCSLDSRERPIAPGSGPHHSVTYTNRIQRGSPIPARQAPTHSSPPSTRAPRLGKAAEAQGCRADHPCARPPTHPTRPVPAPPACPARHPLPPPLTRAPCSSRDAAGSSTPPATRGRAPTPGSARRPTGRR